MRTLILALLPLLAGPTATGSTTPATVASTPSMVVQAPDAISHDCSQDVSRQLTAFLAAQPAGTTVRLAADGCYRVETAVTLSGSSALRIDGQGAVLRRTQLTPPSLQYPKANPVLRLANVTDVEVTDLAIIATNTVSDKVNLQPLYGAWQTRYAFDHGVVILGSSDVDIRDVSIDAVHGDGIYVGASDLNGPARNVTIEDVTIDRNGRQGIAITAANNVAIRRTVIAHSRRSGIDIEPHKDATVTGVEIADSSITAWLVAIPSAGWGSVSDVSVHDNQINRSALPLILSDGRLQGAGTWSVVNNRVTFTVRSSQPAMRFRNTADVVVTGNTVALSAGSAVAVDVARGTRAAISCNTFAGAATRYVTVDTASRADVRSNALRTTSLVPC